MKNLELTLSDVTVICRALVALRSQLDCSATCDFISTTLRNANLEGICEVAAKLKILTDTKREDKMLDKAMKGFDEPRSA